MLTKAVATATASAISNQQMQSNIYAAVRFLQHKIIFSTQQDSKQ
jgi:hypothetical protein